MKAEKYINKILINFNNDIKEATDFICSILDINKLTLNNKNLSIEEINKLNNSINLYLKKIPINYISGYKYFLGNKFKITKDVLIPRNETEQFIETLIKEITSYFYKINLNIVDVGTGSGVIGISLYKHLSYTSNITLLDISLKALKVAKENSQILNTKNINFVKSNVLKKIKQPIDVIVSNPPYISYCDPDVDKNVKKYEPSIALFAKREGLDIIEKLLKQGNKKVSSKWIIAFEFGWHQKDIIENKIKKYLNNMIYNFYKDYSGNWRFVIIKGDKNENSRY